MSTSDLLHGPVALPDSECALHHRRRAHKLPQSHLKQDLMTSIHSIRPMSAPGHSSAAVHNGSSSSEQSKHHAAHNDKSTAVTAWHCASQAAEHKGAVAIGSNELVQYPDCGAVADQQLSPDSLQIAAQHGIEACEAAMQLSSNAAADNIEALGTIEEQSQRSDCLPAAYRSYISQEVCSEQQPGSLEQAHGDSNSPDTRPQSALSTSSSQQHAAQHAQHDGAELDRPERSHARSSGRRRGEAAGQQSGRPTSRSRWLAAQALKLQAGLRHMPSAKVMALMLDICYIWSLSPASTLETHQ